MRAHVAEGDRWASIGLGSSLRRQIVVGIVMGIVGAHGLRPILKSQHAGGCWILDLEPALARSTPVWMIVAHRDDALTAQLAGVTGPSARLWKGHPRRRLTPA
jgi:hypothetical protein